MGENNDRDISAGEDGGQKEIEILQIFKDLKVELKKIKDEKSKLESQLNDVKNNLKNIQTKEMELRDMIAEFADNETKLNNQRITLEKNLGLVTSKLDKLCKVQKELSEVWA
ncbi:MAG: hypothetical protein V1718_06180 [archaeon]